MEEVLLINSTAKLFVAERKRLGRRRFNHIAWQPPPFIFNS